MPAPGNEKRGTKPEDEQVRPRRDKAGARTIERKQTGCCYESQADGIPCPSPHCDCESCSNAEV